MGEHGRPAGLLAWAVRAAVLGCSSLAQAANWTLNLNPNVKHQSIEGWGAHLGGTTDQPTRDAFKSLGMNILRMDLPKDVLTASSTDWSTRVPLSSDINANIAKFNFGVSGVTGQAATAQWMASNVPNFKLIGDAWTPPHWMKGPTGKTSQWIGNPSTDSPSFATPWLSNTYNHWYNAPGGGHYLSATGDSIGGRVRTEDSVNLSEYGQYFAAYVRGFEQQFGLKFSNISLQNESGFENPFDSCTMTIGPQQSNGTYPTDYNQYARCLASVRDAFAQSRITTPIRGPHFANLLDTPSNPWGLLAQMGMINAVRNNSDPTLKNALATYTSNFYQGISENSVKNVAAYWKGVANVPGPWASWAPSGPGIGGDGKQNWFVETGDPGSSWWNSSAQQGAIVVALKMHDALVHADASAYLYWAFNDSDSSGNPSQYGLISTNTVGNPLSSKKYAAFKQFSGIVKPGSIRIDATFAGATGGGTSVGGASEYDTVNGLSASAYLNPADRTISLVFVNMEPSDQTVVVDASLLSTPSFAMWRSSATENYAYLGVTSVVSGKLTLTIPSLSVVSLTGLSNTVIPEPRAMLLLVIPTALLRRSRRGF